MITTSDTTKKSTNTAETHWYLSGSILKAGNATNPPIKMTKIKILTLLKPLIIFFILHYPYLLLYRQRASHSLPARIHPGEVAD
ncbi:hypothetical protein [Burkholderia sp. LA-2-3-30-S1-D2]|uniref:hypothetical protein n=1 Tax=Burkholderia sp. LA-2-3-30-S1-D2 TaxID=1637862 RepID=UPI00131F334F|nr:hypothetical protein [Burkholderia sp. LA-2-3-30-S1-D2]